jgi:UDP-glucose 4-epimerase
MKFDTLRCFKVMGGTEIRGEDNDLVSRLIANVLRVASGMTDRLSVFGNEYGAPACAAIHDSLHVTDQARHSNLSCGTSGGGAPSFSIWGAVPAIPSWKELNSPAN